MVTELLSKTAKCSVILICNYLHGLLSAQRGRIFFFFFYISRGQGCPGVSTQGSTISSVLPSQFPKGQFAGGGGWGGGGWVAPLTFCAVVFYNGWSQVFLAFLFSLFDFSGTGFARTRDTTIHCLKS